MQGFYQIEHLVMAKLISLSFLLLDLDSLMIMKELGNVMSPAVLREMWSNWVDHY